MGPLQQRGGLTGGHDALLSLIMSAREEVKYRLQVQRAMAVAGTKLWAWLSTGHDSQKCKANPRIYKYIYRYTDTRHHGFRI